MDKKVIHTYPQSEKAFQHWTVSVAFGHCPFFTHISILLVSVWTNTVVSLEFCCYFQIILFYFFELHLFTEIFYDI